MGVFSHEFLDATNSTIKDTLFEPSFVKGYSFNLLFVCVCVCASKLGRGLQKHPLEIDELFCFSQNQSQGHLAFLLGPTSTIIGSILYNPLPPLTFHLIYCCVNKRSMRPAQGTAHDSLSEPALRMTLAWIRELAPVIVHVNLPTIAENLACPAENGMRKVAACNRMQKIFAHID